MKTLVRAFAVIMAMLNITMAYAQPVDPLRGLSLANIALSSPSPDALAKWYVEVLGFKVVSTSRGVEGVELTMLERDGLSIDVIKVPNQRPLETPLDPPRHLEIPGLRNLVLWVDDLPAANAHLKKKRCEAYLGKPLCGRDSHLYHGVS